MPWSTSLTPTRNTPTCRKQLDCDGSHWFRLVGHAPKAAAPARPPSSTQTPTRSFLAPCQSCTLPNPVPVRTPRSPASTCLSPYPKDNEPAQLRESLLLDHQAPRWRPPISMVPALTVARPSPLPRLGRAGARDSWILYCIAGFRLSARGPPDLPHALWPGATRLAGKHHLARPRYLRWRRVLPARRQTHEA